jgi:hypothetical protein
VGSLWRAVFEVEFAAAIARLLELTDPTDVAVTGITRGSVVVDFTVCRRTTTATCSRPCGT